MDFGAPLHSLILCSPELHELELEMLNFFSVKNLPKHFRVCLVRCVIVMSGDHLVMESLRLVRNAIPILRHC